MSENQIQLVGVGDGAMVAQLNRSEMDVQISTAKAWPRSIAKFKSDAMTLATTDRETAASMFYALPRDGKTIEGPSARLAEIVGSTWGNMRYGARVIEVAEKTVTAQGIAFDLERNVAVSIEVRRSIWGKRGRFSEDMINVVAQAAVSIALRNAIFKAVPFAFIKDVLTKAKSVATGEGEPMSERQKKAMTWFIKEAGVSESKILFRLGRRSVADITVDDLAVLTGLRTAIIDKEISIEEAFEDGDVTETTKTASGISGKVVEKKTEKVEPPKAEPEKEKPLEPGKVDTGKKATPAADEDDRPTKGLADKAGDIFS